MFRITIPWISAGILCLIAILLIGITDLTVPALTIPILAIFVFLSLSCVILIFSNMYRCPRCNNIPWTDSFTEQGGIDLNPDVCYYCKARLK